MNAVRDGQHCRHWYDEPETPCCRCGYNGREETACPGEPRDGGPPVNAASAVVIITGGAADGRTLKAMLAFLLILAVVWMACWLGERAVDRRTAQRAEQSPPPRPVAAVEITVRWGPRPAVMTRCLECGVNEWPACRCTLARAGLRDGSQP